MAIATDSRATTTAILAPSTTRLRTSRPSSSVPNQWDAEGAEVPDVRVERRDPAAGDREEQEDPEDDDAEQATPVSQQVEQGPASADAPFGRGWLHHDFCHGART